MIEIDGINYEIEKTAIVVGIAEDNKENSIVIPDEILVENTSIKVTEINKKAFMDAKIIEVALGDNVTNIGNWAFANCSMLRCVKSNRKSLEVSFGKDCFMNCKMLKQLCFGVDSEDGISYLTAMAVTGLKEESQLYFDSSCRELYVDHFDEKLKKMLMVNDSEHYFYQSYGGEEDISKSEAGYLIEKGYEKSILCMERLVREAYISEDNKNIYIDYLINTFKDMSVNPVWKLFLQSNGHNIAYFKLLLESNIIKNEKIDEIIGQLDESHGEVVAFLLGQKHKNKKVDIMDMFAL